MKMKQFIFFLVTSFLRTSRYAYIVMSICTLHQIQKYKMGLSEDVVITVVNVIKPLFLLG